MLDILREYLVDAASPEELDMVSNAHDIFDQLGFEGYDEWFIQILALDGDTDPGNTLASILNLTRQIQEGVLHQHGVRPENLCNIQFLTDIIRVLLEIPQTSMLHDIQAICQQPTSAEERFCEVAERLSKHTVEETLPLITFVSQQLMQNILAMGVEEEHHEDDEPDRIFRAERIKKYRSFLDSVQTREIEIQALVEKGVDAGFPFRMYINLIGRDFEAMLPEIAACNLVGMALLSNDGFENPESYISEHIDALISDPDTVTRVMILIRDLLMRFNQHEG